MTNLANSVMEIFSTFEMQTPPGRMSRDMFLSRDLRIEDFKLDVSQGFSFTWCYTCVGVGGHT